MKILVLRFSSIGDIVLTTPVVRCLKKQLNCEVHYATKESMAPILYANKYIDHIITLDGSWRTFIDQLDDEEYDHIIDLHNNLRTLRIQWELRKKAVRFKKLNFKKWLLVNLKINSLPDRHIVDRYMDTVKHLGVENDQQGLDYMLNPNDAYTEPVPPKYEVFAIGGQHKTKKLPNSKIIEYCFTRDAPIVLLGGKEDMRNAAIIKKAVPYAFNLCGKTSLAESAYLIKECEVVHTHDTGMMHIAAAFNKPIVTFWGNTVPEFGMYPYFKNNEVPPRSKTYEIKGLSCRPCSKIGYKKCPKGHFKCMMDLDFKS